MSGGRRWGAGRPQERLQVQQLHCNDVRVMARLGYLLPSMKDVWVRDVLVCLDWQPCRFGGSRPWFLCPTCGRRCAMLYFLQGVAICIRCGKLAYPTQSMDKFERSWYRTRKIEARLGISDSRTQVLSRPKYMREETHSRLVMQLRREQAIRNYIFVGWGKRWFPDLELG